MQRYNSNPTVLIFRREIKRLRDSRILKVQLLLPLLGMVIFWALFRQGLPRELPVLLIDQDHSQLSHKITRMIEASPSLRVSETTAQIARGESLLRRGECYAMVILPADLQKNVLRGEAPRVVYYYNNQYLLAGSIINRDLRRIISTVSAGIDLVNREARGETWSQASSRVEPVILQKRTLYNPYTNYLYFLSGALYPTILQMFVLMVSVYALGIELKKGTAGRLLRLAGGKTGVLLTGKLLPYTIFYFTLGVGMNLFHFYGTGAPLRGSPTLIVLATLLFVLAAQSVAVLLVAVSANVRFALSAGAFYTSTAFAFTGITFPMIGMPLMASIWARLLPLFYYLKLLVDQSMRGIQPAASAQQLGVLVLFLILPVVSSFRLKKIMSDSSYWGRL